MSRLKISYINGVCKKNDAISNSIYNEINWLKEWPAIDVKLFSYECDFNDIPFVSVTEPKDVVFDSFFQESGIIIFHFGIYCPLFDLIAAVPQRAKTMVVFHNITPKKYAAEKDHLVIDKSFKQISNIAHADYVVCDSKENLEVLQKAAITKPMTVLPLSAPRLPSSLRKNNSHNDDLVRIAFIGRLVKSKGPEDLLKSIIYLAEQDSLLKLRVEIIYNEGFSNEDVIKAVFSLSDHIHKVFNDRVGVLFYKNACEMTKFRVLCDADLFVLPSYHEGFCVPILEAMACGCKIVSYSNSNIPAICGGFAKLVPTGNMDLLSKALHDEINKINASGWKKGNKEHYTKYMKEINAYLDDYSYENCKQRFLHYIKSKVRTLV